MNELMPSPATTFRSRSSTSFALVALGCFLLLPSVALSEPDDGRSAADLQLEDFLKNAEVVEMHDIGEGITHPRQITLRQEGRQCRAIFKTVDIESNETHYTSQAESTFSDRYVYEVAAYRLDRLLGLNLVPVTVLRKIGLEEGSVQFWIDDAISMQEAVDDGLESKNLDSLLRNLMQMWVLDALIYNVDRNYTNILINPANDAFWLIDHSRAFRTYKSLPKRQEQRDIAVPATVAERLRALDQGQLQAALGGLLEKHHIKPILARRDKLVADLSARGLLP